LKSFVLLSKSDWYVPSNLVFRKNFPKIIDILPKT